MPPDERFMPPSKPLAPERRPVNVAFFALSIVSAVAYAFCAVPLDPAGATWNISEPPAPVPVPAEPLIVKFVPAVLLVPATTLWTCRVCATGAAASAAPSWRVAVVARVR